MTWKEILTPGEKLTETPDKIKFYLIFISAGFIFAVIYNLLPFLYPQDFLKAQTDKEVAAFVADCEALNGGKVIKTLAQLKQCKPLEDAKYSFLKKHELASDAVVFCGISKYTNYKKCIGFVDPKNLQNGG